MMARASLVALKQRVMKAAENATSMNYATETSMMLLETVPCSEHSHIPQIYLKMTWVVIWGYIWEVAKTGVLVYAPKYYIVLIIGTPNFWKPPYVPCIKAVSELEIDLVLRMLKVDTLISSAQFAEMIWATCA